MAKKRALEVLDELKTPGVPDRDTLVNVARTSLRTKLHQDLADSITEVRTIVTTCNTVTVHSVCNCCGTFVSIAQATQLLNILRCEIIMLLAISRPFYKCFCFSVAHC